ncbi:MAG: nitrilase-related carbon-nitrogen hydrolase, partial [Azospirillaceae bacterium]
MTDTLVLALAQLNPVMGDIDGNADRILTARQRAAGQHADLVVATELGVTGYP